MTPEKINVTKRNGKTELFDPDKINKAVERACRGLEDTVSVNEVVTSANYKIYDGISTKELDSCNIMAAREMIEKEPNYEYVAARLFLDTIYKEVFGEGVDSHAFEYQYRKTFIKNLKKLVKAGIIDPRLQDFDLKRLAESLDIERDRLWKYYGLQIIYDRYLLHIENRRMESPQSFFMRVAMGLSLNEENKTEKAIEFYNILSNFLFLSSTPTLFNSGTTHPQLSSCYLSTVDDDINSIFGTGVHNQALLSKFAGGLGVDWSNIRATGSHIKGTNGDSLGLIPWIHIFNSMVIAVNQGGKRQGSGCVYIEPWHLDFFDFLELRKNTGDHRRRAHDTNTAVWIPDLFMDRVAKGEKWTLFCPNEAKNLHNTYGKEFEKLYLKYEDRAEKGKIKNYKVVDAKTVWKSTIKSVFETGHPWVTFKDPSNLRYSNSHQGVVNSSNLCTEILLHTKSTKYDERGNKEELGETAVCNLGSVNLSKHIINGELDVILLEKTVKTAIRMLDNVIDINYYPIEEAEKSNKSHRPIGLGVMGYHDALFELDIPYESEASIDFADFSQELISYYAIDTSIELAKERGKYDTYDGSLWSKGKLPIDTYKDFMSKYRSKDNINLTTQLGKKWDKLRDKLKKFGIRNGNIMAIAPTATISNIAGTSSCTEPYIRLIFAKQAKSGVFTSVNKYFIEEAKSRNLWCNELLEAMKVYDGLVTKISGIPEDMKKKYKTAFEIEPHYLIHSAARRQKWIDMGQSLNLFVDFGDQKPSGKLLSDMYMLAWELGLKTTYYLKSNSATAIDKSTVKSLKNGEIYQDKVENIDVQLMQSPVSTTCSLNNYEECEVCQ